MSSDSGDRQMALVAVEAVRGALASVAGVGVHGRDDAVPRYPPRNHEAPAVVLLEVLPHHGRTELARPLDVPVELPALQHPQAARYIGRQLVDERPRGLAVLPVARRLPRGPVVVIALQHRPQLGPESGRIEALRLPQQPAERRAEQRHRVLRGDGVVERRGVQHTLSREQLRLARHRERGLEDAPGALGAGEASPHRDQDRVHEARRVVVESAAGELPAGVPLEGRHRLAVGEAVESLQHHDRGDDAGRNAAAAASGEEVCEHLVGEEAFTLAGQEGPDGVPGNPLSDVGGALEEVGLPGGLSECHGRAFRCERN